MSTDEMNIPGDGMVDVAKANDNERVPGLGDMAGMYPAKAPISAPIPRRHIALMMWMQNVKRPHYGTELLQVLARGGIVTLPSSTPAIDNYARHVVSLKGELGPCAMWYDGTELIRMSIGLHGFAIIGGLRPSDAHAITGTHLRGYQLDIAELTLGMTWGEVQE